MADRLGADPAVMRRLAHASPDNSRSTFLIVWRRIAGAPQTPAIGIGLVLGLLTVTPLAILLVGSFRPDGLPATPGWTVEHYIDVWGSAYDWQLVANTLVFSGTSTILAVTLATALSWLLERTDLPARDLFRAMILMPMATPPLLLAIGWALLLAPRIGIVWVALQPLIGPIDRWFDIYSMPGAILVQTLAYVPTSVLMLSPAIRALDPDARRSRSSRRRLPLADSVADWLAAFAPGAAVGHDDPVDRWHACLRRSRSDRHTGPRQSHEH